jgi:hypothetical protein
MMAESFFRSIFVQGTTVPRLSHPGFILWLAGLLLLLSQVTAPAQESAHQLKAEMIYNFLLFVDWPEQTFPEETSPISICLLGKDPLGEVLPRELGDRRVNDQPLKFQEVGSGEQASKCHLLIISRSQAQQLEEILALLKNKPVLTVSDIKDFCIRGGMIELAGEENKVEFDLNTALIEEAGLNMDSGLKRLARVVDCKEM